MSEINLLQYPSNLGEEKGESPSRYPHYVVFFVNRNMKTVIGKDTPSGATASFRGSISNPEDKSDKNNGITSQAGGMLRGAMKGVINSETSSKVLTPEQVKQGNQAVDSSIRTMSRITEWAIALPMPNDVQTSYGMDYSEVSANAIGAAILGGGEDIKNAIASGSTIDALKAITVGQAPEVLARSTVGGVASMGISGDSEAFMGGMTGKVLNPKAETLFRSTHIRSHDFNWVFMPRTQKETEDLFEIIKRFKIHMHPELQAADKSTFLITPDEFDIEFYYKNEVNDKIHRIATSVLESVSVNYSNNGTYMGFAGDVSEGGGAPISIQLSLKFKETQPLHRAFFTGDKGGTF